MYIPPSWNIHEMKHKNNNGHKWNMESEIMASVDVTLFTSKEVTLYIDGIGEISICHCFLLKEPRANLWRNPRVPQNPSWERMIYIVLKNSS